MHFIVSLLVAVAANVIAYFICKWLDRNNKNKGN